MQNNKAMNAKALPFTETDDALCWGESWARALPHIIRKTTNNWFSELRKIKLWQLDKIKL